MRQISKKSSNKNLNYVHNVTLLIDITYSPTVCIYM